MADVPIWQWAVGPWRDANPQYEIRNIQDRKLTFKLTEPDEATYSVLGDLPDAAYMHELISDLRVTRNGQVLGRYRHISSDDNIDTNDYTVGFNCISYAGLLGRRIVDGETSVQVPSTTVSQPGLPLYQATPEDTLWYLIDYAQGKRYAPPGAAPPVPYVPKPDVPGMDLGITKGSWPDLNVKTLSYQFFEEGSNILENIHQVIRTGEFDFWIDSDRKAHIAQKRGRTNQVALDFGGRIQSVKRSFSHEAFANYLRQSGSFEGVAVRFPTNLNELVGVPEGVWMTALGKPEAIDDSDPVTLQPELLLAIGEANYKKLKNSMPLSASDGGGNFSYNVQLTPGAWGGPDHVWVGDTVRLVLKRGRLSINHDMRVVEIQIDIDQNNVESISMTLNWPDNAQDDLRGFVAVVRALNVR